MNNSELLALYDREQRIEIQYPGVRKERLPGPITDGLPKVVRFTRPAPGANFILYSHLEPGEADAVIKEQIEYFKGFGQPFDWKVCEHDSPPDLKERLAAHGFVPEDPDAIMLLDLQQAPPELLAPPPADVRRIQDRAGLKDVIDILEDTWNRDFNWVNERMGGDLEVPGYMSLYVAYADGQPACTGWTFFHPDSQFASLWGGSTKAVFRKRGLYTAILAARVQEARRRGRRFMTIDASPMSRPIVEKYGFILLTRAHVCDWPEE